MANNKQRGGNPLNNLAILQNGSNTNPLYLRVGIIDVSLYNAQNGTPAEYDSLADAIAAVPARYQMGGISIRFISTVSGEYVQYRLFTPAWSDTTTDWVQEDVVDRAVRYGTPGQVLALDADGKPTFVYPTEGMVVDNTMSDVSPNPVQNAVVTKATRTAVGYFDCSTAAATAAKEVTADGYVLAGGGSIKVKFEHANSAADPTLNINNTGAKAVVYNGVAADATNTWADEEVVEFYYDPTYDSNAGGWIGKSTVISVSHNTSTGHADIRVGGTITPVASVEEVHQLQQEVEDTSKINYFNKNSITHDAYIAAADGSVVTGAGAVGWWCSSFIQIDGGKIYSISQIRDFAFYDANMRYISGDSNAYTDYTFTAPLSAAYMRFSGYTEFDPNTIMLNEGAEVLPYVEYGVWFLKQSIIPVLGDDKIGAGLNGNKILQQSINSEKLSEGLILRTNNLFNQETAILDAYIRVADGSVATGATGWWCSDFIQVVPETTYICTWMRDFVFYDENKQYISGSEQYLVGQPITTPSGARFLRFSWYKNAPEETPDVTMFNQGETLLPYEPFAKLNPDLLAGGVPMVDGKSIVNGSIDVEKLDHSVVQRTENLFNKYTITQDAYINGNTGAVVTGAGAVDWWCSDFIQVEAGEQYNGSPIRDFAFYDANKQYVSGQGSAPTLPITVPAGVTYIRFSQYQYSTEDFMFNKGSEALPYVPYAQLNPSLLPVVDEYIDISLPNKIYAVVGDTLQLFFRGIIKAVDPYVYDICVTADGGRMYPRYFEFTPQSTGTITFNLKVKTSDGKVINSKGTTIEVKEAVAQPSSPKNVLFIGDSLTAAGVYTQEAYRRLTGSGGTPAGDGFGNIAFVGRKPYGDIHAEGNSGWTWADYTTEADRAYAECHTLTVNAVTVIPQIGAIYKDANDNQFAFWWDYSNTKLKFATPLLSSVPQNGVLTKVSGVGDDTITWTAAVKSSINPFWNDETEQLDFPAYVDKWCGGTIDVVYTLLTWNGLGSVIESQDFSSLVGYATTLFRHIHSNYPDVKIKMMGVQVPDCRQGMGSLGAPRENGYTDMYGLIVTALNMNKAYEDLCNEAEFSSYVEFVNVSSQVDSEYNMPFVEKDVNTRNSDYKDKVGTNDVHPSTPGYLQIADVVYRNFIAHFCQ